MTLPGIVSGVEDVLRTIPFPVTDPMVAASLIGLLVILAVIGFSLFRYLRRTPGQKFARLFREIEEVAILMHPNPDPDAMAAALAVAEIAKSRDTETSVYYPGQIRHHENRAFEAVLDVEFDRIERADGIEEEKVVLVDHNESRDFPNAETINPIAVIDHHPGEGNGKKFTDIRTDYGACATILAEYFDELGWIPADPEAEGNVESNATILPSDLATGLIFGIQSDTKNLTSGCSEAEFDAARYLYAGINEDKLERIATPDMDAESLDIKARAITERDVRAAFAVSDVGTVSNADAIPQAADELRRLEGVNAVVVFGDKDGVIRLSGRSTDDRVHMGKILASAVEDIPMAGAGGHARMGGGTVPIEHMKGLGPSEGLTREGFVDRLFDALNGEL